MTFAQIQWTSPNSNTAGDLKDVVFTDDTFVAVGTLTTFAAAVTSPDGTTWTAQSVTIGGIFHSVAYGNDRLVAVGTNSASAIAGVSTDDGVTWTGGPKSDVGPAFYGVAWTGTEFVAVGGTTADGVIATSPDGDTWTGGTTGFASNFKGVVSEGTTRVVVGSTGVILYSLDGGPWTAAANIPNVDWEDVFFAAGKFLVVGAQGQIMTSADGVTWTLGTSGTGDNLFGTTAIGVPEVWVSVGSDGRVLVSNDASGWTTLPQPTSAILNSVTWGVPSGGTNAVFVAVANLGQIITSPGPEPGGSTLAAFANDPLNIDSSSQQFNAAVTAGGTTSWTAIESEDWIFLGAASGTGNGEFTGSVTANPSAQPRTGLISIGSDTLSIIQAGADLTPPSFLSAQYSESDGGIKLSWGNVLAADSFVIERRAGEEDPWEEVLTVTNDPTTMAVDDTIIQGDSYQYRIRSVSGDLESGWTDPVEGGSPPATPDNLSATARNATQIQLRWSDVNGETSYRISRGLVGSFFDAAFEVAANETTFIDVGLDPETEYKYNIQAVALNFSPESPEVTATTLSRDGSIRWGEVSRVSNNYNGVAFGNGVAIVVGDAGRITRSTDLGSWDDVESGTEEDLLDVHFANNLFVAVGSKGTTLYSSDGQTWTAGDKPTDDSLVSVSYLNGWYAVGAGGALVSSSDGDSWTELASPAENDSGFVDIFAGPKLVAIEDSGRFVTSDDGTNWTETRANAPDDDTEPFFWTRTAGAYGGGTYGVVGPASYTSTSADANTWSDQTGEQFQYFDAVAYGGDRFVAVAGRSGYSFGGAFYLGGNDPPSLLTCITYTGSTFLAAGNRGLIATSPDGVTWTAVQDAAGSAANLTLVASDGGRLVAMGTRFNNQGFQEPVTIYNTLDGSGWSDEMPLTVDGVDNDTFFNELSFLNGQFFLLGSNSVIMTSPNGESFVTRNSESGFLGAGLTSVAAQGSLYLVGGSGETLMQSVDSGVSWAEVENLPFGFNAEFLTYSNRWSGGSGNSFSEDGVTWQPTNVFGLGTDSQASVLGNYANAPLYVGVSSGFSGANASLSSDGRNWTGRSIESDSPPDNFFNSVAYGAGVFVATAFPNSSGDAVWASVDGVHWETAPTSAFEEGFFTQNGAFEDVVFHQGDNAFYGVGALGMVVRFEVSSSDFVPPGPEHRLGIEYAGGMIKVEWPTFPDYNYLLRSNNGLDPANWIPIGTPEAGDGTTKMYQVSEDAITIPQFWSLQVEEN